MRAIANVYSTPILEHDDKTRILQRKVGSKVQVAHKKNS
jgi:hypothetical protein